MSVTKLDEYRHLELDSSNLLMEWDASKVLGRDVEAAHLAFRAGEMRERMGLIRQKEGDLVGAAEDWLSATECFLQATAPGRARMVYSHARQLAEEGHIPAGRQDLWHALEERKRFLAQLDGMANEWEQDFLARGYQFAVPSTTALEYLQSRLEVLPSHARLHYAIFRQADQLGQPDLAEAHLNRARLLEPSNANFTALLGHRMIREGRYEQARRLGAEYLEYYPSPTQSDHVRIMLAKALAPAGNTDPDERRQALEILRPLTESNSGADDHRVAEALALAAQLELELGEQREAERLIHRMEELGKTIEDSSFAFRVVQWRNLLVESAADVGAREANRRKLFEQIAA